MKDTYDLGICEWMVVIVSGECHDIRVCARVHGVLSQSYIVSCIVDSHNLVEEDPLVFDEQP